MRKALLLCIGAIFASTLGTGHAASLASCTGQTSFTPNPPGLGGGCEQPFSLSALTSVTLELTAAPGFTGFMRGQVTPLNNGSGGGFPVEATYVAGSLVMGQASKTYSLAAGTWRLIVHTQGKVCNPYQLIPQLPGCQTFAVGVGTFTGTLSVATQGAPEPAP